MRAVLGLGAGTVREVGEVAIPAALRRTQLYQNMVDALLRFLIENVGGVEGVYAREGELDDSFLASRTAGNAIEALGVVAFYASPVWVLAALADLTGTGRRLIPEIAAALEREGLLEGGARFTTVDQVLEGLERTSGRLARTVNTPPLDVAGLRREWEALKEEARGIKPGTLPSPETIGDLWTRLAAESARQGRSVFETSSLLALDALRSLPAGLRRFGASGRVGASSAGRFFYVPVLDHYRSSLAEMERVGYLAYARRQLTPYVRGAARQFFPSRATLTERVIGRLCARHRR